MHRCSRYELMLANSNGVQEGDCASRATRSCLRPSGRGLATAGTFKRTQVTSTATPPVPDLDEDPDQGGKPLSSSCRQKIAPPVAQSSGRGEGIRRCCRRVLAKPISD